MTIPFCRCAGIAEEYFSRTSKLKSRLNRFNPVDNRPRLAPNADAVDQRFFKGGAGVEDRKIAASRKSPNNFPRRTVAFLCVAVASLMAGILVGKYLL
jgi:hypothetical protein